jgi:hypothetical protein
MNKQNGFFFCTIEVRMKSTFIIYLEPIDNIVKSVKISNFIYWSKIDYEGQFRSNFDRTKKETILLVRYTIKVREKSAFIIYLELINNIVNLVKFSNFTY